MPLVMHESDPRFKDFENIYCRDWSWSDNGKIYHRENELVLSSRDLYHPTLTVVLATKWYSLYLLHLPCGGNVFQQTDRLEIYRLGFNRLEDTRPEGASAFVDHVPNPDAVRLFARRNEFEVDGLALDLMIGRWQNEVVGFMDMECDRCDGAGQIPRREIDGVMPGTCRKCRGLGVLKHNE